jgi:tetratricopeptide (TPR) repeat protein
MRPIDPSELFLKGRRLSAEDANGLELRLVESPNDLPARITLLGYYSVTWQEPSLTERNRHILWLVAHHPELDVGPLARIDETLSPDAYAEASRLWHVALAQQPNNPAVLKSASKFVTFADPAFSKELLRHGAALEPDCADWHKSIGNLCMLTARHDEGERVTAAREALAEFQKALDLEPSDTGRYQLMIDSAEAASFADDFDTAMAFAERLLTDAPKFEGSWIHGNGLHHAHIVLGRVALARGDVQSAKEHLLASAEGPTSPQLGSFGPDQQLALALLSRGERDGVVAYAEACKHRFGVSLGMLGALFRSADGEPPRLQVVRNPSA